MTEAHPIEPQSEVSHKSNISTKSVISFTIAELITTAAGLITLIMVLVTFFVSYNGTKQTVETLAAKVASTNAKLERIIGRLDKQGTALDAIVDRDISLQNYISKHSNHF